ncbi:MAG: hypothetical protein QOD75_924 [Blastocatellia bacterium]|nr:hypothetical protein [Blastocatellia bacterium]
MRGRKDHFPYLIGHWDDGNDSRSLLGARASRPQLSAKREKLLLHFESAARGGRDARAPSNKLIVASNAAALDRSEAVSFKQRLELPY